MPLLGNHPPSQWRECFGIENGLLLARERSTRITFTNAVVELLEPPDQDDEYLAATPTPQRVALGIPAYRGLRTSNYMYVEYITGEKELYDLKSDPYQLQNLAAKADAQLLAVLAARLKELQTCRAAECRTIEDKPIK